MKKSECVRSESAAVDASSINPFAGLGAPLKVTRSSGENKQQLPKFPPILTKKIITKIATLERWLRIHGRDSQWREIPSWDAVLDEYRASLAFGVLNPRFMQKYGPLCLAAVESLEEAFQDRHSYDPDDYLTQGVKAAAGRHSKLGKVLDSRAQAERLLRDSDYLNAPRAPRGNSDEAGSKAAIKNRVQLKTGVSNGVFFQLVKELKDKM